LFTFFPLLFIFIFNWFFPGTRLSVFPFSNRIEAEYSGNIPDHDQVCRAERIKKGRPPGSQRAACRKNGSGRNRKNADVRRMRKTEPEKAGEGRMT